MTVSLSRRTFLGAATGAVGCALVGRASMADDAKPGGFLLGIQSYSLRSYDVAKALEHVHEFGLHGIEFFGGHFSHESSSEQIDAMKQRCAELDIKILGHGVNGFGKDHDANRKFFEFARRAGIRNLSADPSEDAFDSLDKLVAEYDIRIAIHNHGPGARYDKIADVLAAVKGRHKNIGACADLGHYIRSGEDPVKAVALLEGRLFGIHLKDFAEPRGDAPGVILGKGQLDVEEVFKALKKVKFPADGCLSLEYEEHAEDPLADIRECLAIATAAAKKAA